MFAQRVNQLLLLEVPVSGLNQIFPSLRSHWEITSQNLKFEYRCVARLFKRDVANNSLSSPLHILVGTKRLGFEDSDVSVGVGL